MTGSTQALAEFHARWTEDRTRPQPLRMHLAGVSRRSQTFAEVLKLTDSSFVAAARLAGLLHDLGKYRVEFQNYLNIGDRGRRSNETAHAIYGAAAVLANWDALAAAFAIAGHHAGLHDQDQLAGQISSQKFQALDRFPELLSQADKGQELAGVLEKLKPKNEVIVFHPAESGLPRGIYDAGRLQPLLPDLDLLVVDAQCYDLQRGIVFRERPPEDFVQ